MKKVKRSRGQMKALLEKAGLELQKLLEENIQLRQQLSPPDPGQLIVKPSLQQIREVAK